MPPCSVDAIFTMFTEADVNEARPDRSAERKFMGDRTVSVTRHPHCRTTHHIQSPAKRVEVQPNGELDENGNAVWSITGGRVV